MIETSLIGWENWVDTATLTALNDGPLTLGVDRLKLVHVSQYHEQTGNTLTVRLDLGAARTVNAAFFAGTNLTAGGLIRVIASNNADMAGAAYDSGSTSAHADPRIGYALHLLANPVTARYWQISLSDSALAAVRAGRLFVGPMHVFNENFDLGWNRKWTDPSEKEWGDGGQLFVTDKARRRVFTMQYAGMDRVEADTVALEVERVCGVSSDVLLVTWPSAPNLIDYTIWGVPSDTGGVTNTSFNVYTKNFTIDERRR